MTLGRNRQRTRARFQPDAGGGEAPVVGDFLINNDGVGANSFTALWANSDATLAGKTVVIAPGFYSQQSIPVGRVPATPLVFTAQYPITNRPVINGFIFQGCSNLTFTKLKIVRNSWTAGNSASNYFGSGTNNDLTWNDCEVYSGYRGDYNQPFDTRRKGPPWNGFDYPEYACLLPQFDASGVVTSVIIQNAYVGAPPGGGAPLVADGTNIPITFSSTSNVTFTVLPTGEMDVSGGNITAVRVLTGGTTSPVFSDANNGAFGVLSKIITWTGQSTFQDNMAWGWQSAGGATVIGNFTITNCLIHDVSNAIKCNPTNGGTLTVVGNTFWNIYQDYISFGANGSGGTLPPVVVANWNFGYAPFSAVGDPKDPHSDFIQCFANDISAPSYSIGRMSVQAIGNIALSRTQDRGYFQAILLSDSPFGMSGSVFAFGAELKYNIIATRRLPIGINLSNLHDGMVWRNTIIRYAWNDAENATQTINCTMGASDINPAGAASLGTNLYGNNITEQLSSRSNTTNLVDFARYPNILMGGAPPGRFIPYTTVLDSPTAEPLTVADVLAAYESIGIYATGNKGAWTNDGAVNYVARTVDLTKEPSFLLFPAEQNVAVSTVRESARSKLISGPATIAFTSTGGTLREYLAATGGTGTVMGSSGTLTKGRFYTLEVTSSASPAATVTASVTCGGDTYEYQVATAWTPYTLADNQNVAYSTTTSGWAGTSNMQKFLIAAQFQLDAVAANTRIVSFATGTPMNLNVGTGRFRFQLVGGSTCGFDIIGYTPNTTDIVSIVISVDFTQANIGDGVRCMINGVSYECRLTTGFISGTLVDVNTFGTLNVLAYNNGTGLVNGKIGMFYMDWGTSGYSLVDITDPNVYNGFSLDNINNGGTGFGPTGAAPQLLFHDSVANWNAGTANKGSFAGKTMSKIAGTYI